MEGLHENFSGLAVMLASGFGLSPLSKEFSFLPSKQIPSQEGAAWPAGHELYQALQLCSCVIGANYCPSLSSASSSIKWA